MKRKTIAIIIGLALSVSLTACSRDKLTSANNSDAERIEALEQEIEELEQEIEELEAENQELKSESGDLDTADNSQQSGNEVENLMKTTVESPETSGVCGADLTWYYQNGVLVIKGTGAMTEYSSGEDMPWYDLREKIGWVIIDEGGNNSRRLCI